MTKEALLKDLAIIALLIIIGALVYLTIERREAPITRQEVATSTETIPMDSMNSALKINIITEGTGTVAENGKTVSVNYRGTLADGTQFDSSYDRNEPLTFILGGGQVIQGWELGILGMKVGEKRKLTIPPELGYGPNGFPPVIPANATLTFDVELVAVQ